MFNKEEKELEKMKEGYRNVTIPDNIDEFIRNGIKKGRKYKRSKLRRKFTGIAAALLITVFSMSIRLSPGFAEMVSNIPGLDYIVKLINYDKGLMLALENDFVQHIDASDEHEDLVFTVEDIIIDESRMILFYSIENKGNHENVNISRVNFLNKQDNTIPVCWGIEYFNDNDMNKERKLYGKINVSFSEKVEIPDIIKMEVKLNESKLNEDDRELVYSDLESTWLLDIPVDKEKFKELKEVYEVDKTISIEGQKITFERLILYPTRIALDVVYDENNSKKIFSFVDLKIIDEKDEYASIKNGVTASYIDDNKVRLYLESNYFTKPKELLITAKGITALDKEKLEIKIDLKNKEIINPPDDRLELKDIDATTEGIDLIFNFRNENPNHHCSVFTSKFKDISGKEYHSKWIDSTTGIGQFNEIHYKIENKKYENPIILTITNYPNIIEEEIKIKVK